MNRTITTLLILATLALPSFNGCAGTVSSTGNPPQTAKTYIASSNVGDVTTWTIDSSAGTFSLLWQVISSGAGTIRYTISASGSCGSVDSSFGYRSCTVMSATCASGTSICPGTLPVGEVIQLLEVSDTALVAYAPVENVLHTGVAAGDCSASISGDYSFINTAIGGADLFGMYRSDATFSSIVHSDLGIYNPGTPSLGYVTTDGGGTGARTVAAGTCSGGIRTYSVAGYTLRANFSPSGMFIFDYPSGLGGTVGFRTDLAASVSDLANKTFYGFVYPSSGSPTLARLQTGGVTGSSVALSSLVYQTGPQPNVTGQSIRAASSSSTYNLNGNPPGPSATFYSMNILAATYSTPGAIPGLFFDSTGIAAGSGTFLIGMKDANSKALLFGVQFDNSSGSSTADLIFFEQ